jgi:hypothetical protein
MGNPMQPDGVFRAVVGYLVEQFSFFTRRSCVDGS